MGQVVHVFLNLFLVNKNGTVAARRQPRGLDYPRAPGVVRERFIHSDCWVWARTEAEARHFVRESQVFRWARGLKKTVF